MRYMTIWMAALGLCVSMLTGCATVSAVDTGKGKKVVFIAGTPSHAPGDHEHRAGSMLLSEKLKEGYPEVDSVVTYYGFPKDTSIFDGADTVVVYCDGGRGHLLNDHMEYFQTLMDKGVGLVCMHYGVETTKGEKGDKFLEWLGGYFEPNWSVNPTWEASFTGFPDHVITRGVSPFKSYDEWYFHMRFVPNMKGVTPILSTVAPESTMSRKDGLHSGNPDVRKAVAAGEPQHMAWAYERENGGRSFGFTGGHYHKNWLDDDFRTVMLNAIAWTAHMDIPATGVASSTPTEKEINANLDEKGKKIYIPVLATPLAKTESGWVSIFNGKDLEGWTPKIRTYELGENWAATFRVEDGLMTVSYDGYDNKFDRKFGHIFYKNPYSHYRFRMEYRFIGDQIEDGPGWAFRNSGIMLHSPPPEAMAKDQNFPVSIEIQLLGGDGTEERPTANMCSPGTHIERDGEVIKNHCVKSESKTFHGDQWVAIEVVVDGNDSIKHYINGELVMEYQHPQLDPGDDEAKLVIEANGGDRMLSSGYISLQSESHPVQFRNIEIMDLSKDSKE